MRSERVSTFSRLLNLTAFMVLIALTFSCVGTLDSTEPEKTNVVGQETDTLSFEGVQLIQAISHDKVEVYFFPPSSNPEDVTFYIYHDGLYAPLSVAATSLETDYRGYMRYVITGLQVATTYSVKVEAFDRELDITSANNNVEIVTTYDNVTAEFHGLASAVSLPGIAGMYGIKVTWPSANSIGTSFNPNELDVKGYVVTVLNADTLTPADFDNTSYSAPQRMVYEVSEDSVSYIVNALTPGTNYYVRVRSLHFGYYQNSSDSSYNVERNNKYAKIATYSDDISDIDFDAAGFLASLGAGELGLSTINTVWSSPVGVFSHFRIYYSTEFNDAQLTLYSGDIVCNGQETTDSGVYCKQLDYDATGAMITDLTALSDYKMVLMVCVDDDCGLTRRIPSSVASIRTEPKFASFGGITSVEMANDVNNLDHAQLNISSPLLSSGMIHGLLVQYNGADGTEAHSLNHPFTANNTSLGVLPFNYETDSTIIVTGVDIVSGSAYCFTVTPFIYASDSSIELDSTQSVQICYAPIIEAPSEFEFLGVSNCMGITGGYASVMWVPPTAGLYSHYDLYIREAGSTFSYASAVSGLDPAYTHIRVDGDVTQYTIPYLASGTTYVVGVLTYFSLQGIPYRSEYNAGVTTCTIP